MAKYLHYGNDEIHLPDDADLASLISSLAAAQDEAGYLNVDLRNGGRGIFAITAHIPIWVEEKQGARSIF